MAREWTILAAIGTVLIFSGSPATASVPNSGSDARGVTAAGPVSGAERSGLDELLERSGLRVQLEGLAAGVRVQFLRGQGRISSQDRATIDRIASTNFDADAIYSRIKLEFERNLDAEKLAGALAWYRSPLGKRITALELMALAFEKGWDSAVSIERKQASLQRIALVERPQPDPRVPARAARVGPRQQRSARRPDRDGPQPYAGADPRRVPREHASRLSQPHGPGAGRVREVRGVRGRPVVHERDEQRAPRGHRRRGRGHRQRPRDRGASSSGRPPLSGGQGFRKRIAPKKDSADDSVSSESIATEMTPGFSGCSP